MKSKVLEKEISDINIETKVVQILRNNNVVLVNDLWVMNRKGLKAFGLSDQEIHNIIVKLQLVGLDLGKKKY